MNKINNKFNRIVAVVFIISLLVAPFGTINRVYAAAPTSFPANYDILAAKQLYEQWMKNKNKSVSTLKLVVNESAYIKGLPLSVFDANSEQYLARVSNIMEMAIPISEIYHSYSLKYLESRGKKTCNYLDTSIKIDRFQQYSALQAKVNAIASDIMGQAFTDRERVTLANQYLVEHITYDTTLGANLPEGDARIWEAWGALNDGVAVCSGYANAFFLLCEAMNIPVVSVVGYQDRKDPNDPNEIGHEWNEVFIENKWYIVDVTANDPIIVGGTMSDSEKNKLYSKSFLLVDKKKLIYEKYEWDEKTLNTVKEIAYPNLVEDKADVLKGKGLFAGDDRGYRLNDQLNRTEMAIMLSRITGGTEEIIKNQGYYESLCTFKDVPDWAKAQVGYCVSKGLIKGVGNQLFGAGNMATKKDYCTVILRAKGITAGYDYNTSMDKAYQLGYLSGYRWLTTELNRADVVAITFNTL